MHSVNSFSLSVFPLFVNSATYRQPLTPDRLLTFLVALSTLVLKPSFSQSISLQNPLCLAQTHLPEFDQSVFGSHWWW